MKLFTFLKLAHDLKKKYLESVPISVFSYFSGGYDDKTFMQIPISAYHYGKKRVQIEFECYDVIWRSFIIFRENKTIYSKHTPRKCVFTQKNGKMCRILELINISLFFSTWFATMFRNPWFCRFWCKIIPIHSASGDATKNSWESIFRIQKHFKFIRYWGIFFILRLSMHMFIPHINNINLVYRLNYF